jgi:hypothetical protein
MRCGPHSISSGCAPRRCLRCSPITRRANPSFNAWMAVDSRRFAHQQMYVLRHHHVSHYYPAIASPYPFQHLEEQVPTLRDRQQRLPPIATEGDEVQVVSTMPAFQAPRHASRIEVEVALCGD